MTQLPHSGQPHGLTDEMRYLLGRMPDAQRDLFVERIVADAELSDRVRDAENDLLDAYARGELAPEVRRDVERCLLATGRQRERAAFAAVWNARETRGAAGKRKMLAWMAAVAAMILLATAILWQRREAPRPAVEVAVLALPGGTVRSGAIPEFTIPPSATQVEVRIPIEPLLAQGSLRGLLRNDRGVELWQGAISRGANGLLIVRIDRRIFTGSSFELAVFRQGSDETLAYYYFRIQ